MSKQLISVAYWIGMASTVLAIIDRGLLMIGVSVFPGMAQPAGKAPLSPKSFLGGAVLFFVMAIASYVKWDKTEKLSMVKRYAESNGLEKPEQLAVDEADRVLHNPGGEFAYDAIQCHTWR